MDENLWSLDDDIKIESPIEILKNQIKYLEKMTEKSVSADLILVTKRKSHSTKHGKLQDLVVTWMTISKKRMQN